jgi:hypothetical protein
MVQFFVWQGIADLHLARAVSLGAADDHDGTALKVRQPTTDAAMTGHTPVPLKLHEILPTQGARRSESGEGHMHGGINQSEAARLGKWNG